MFANASTPNSTASGLPSQVEQVDRFPVTTALPNSPAPSQTQLLHLLGFAGAHPCKWSSVI